MYVTIIVSLLLFGCLINGLPYAYFQVLRWVVCGVCGYKAYLAFSLGKKVWMWVFICFVVLFNPIAPLYLDRGVWRVVDVVLAMVLLASLRVKKKPNPSH